MMKTLLKLLLFVPFAFNAYGDELTTEEPAQAVQWVDLLEGANLTEKWQPAKTKGRRSKNIGERWNFNEGVLELKRKEVAEGRGGSIETVKKYFNFELQFEFKIEFDSNSGIKYRQMDATGFEYQIIDDANYRDNSVSHRTGELYEIKEEEQPRVVKKHGEWNTGKIIANGTHLEHWLNGQKVFDIEIGSEEWKERYEDSKYHKKGIAGFGSNAGFIYIQDHSDTGITFRKMIIREL